jgi:hypothetical protein
MPPQATAADPERPVSSHSQSFRSRLEPACDAFEKEREVPPAKAPQNADSVES